MLIEQGYCDEGRIVVQGLSVFTAEQTSHLILQGLGADQNLVLQGYTSQRIIRRTQALNSIVPHFKVYGTNSVGGINLKAIRYGYHPVLTRYATPIWIEMSTLPCGLEIRYTLDGSLPTATSEIYTSPIRFEENLSSSYDNRVKAAVFDANGGTRRSSTAETTFGLIIRS